MFSVLASWFTLKSGKDISKFLHIITTQQWLPVKHILDIKKYLRKIHKVISLPFPGLSFLVHPAWAD